jgi:hypothetical protein
VDGEFFGRIIFRFGDKAGGRDEHAAGAAGGVEDAGRGRAR